LYFDIIFETTAQIQEVEFGGKYGYMRANTDIRGQNGYLTVSNIIVQIDIVWYIFDTRLETKLFAI
jgi:hypothetical protein